MNKCKLLLSNNSGRFKSHIGEKFFKNFQPPIVGQCNTILDLPNLPCNEITKLLIIIKLLYSTTNPRMTYIYMWLVVEKV